MGRKRNKRECRAEGCTTHTRGIEGFCTAHRDLSINRKYQRLKEKASSRGIPLTITLSQYEQVVEDRSCFYCGGMLPNVGYGLDRVDSSKGYHAGNVVACCGDCNSLKGDRFNHEQTKILVDFIQLMKQTDWMKPQGKGEK